MPLSSVIFAVIRGFYPLFSHFFDRKTVEIPYLVGFCGVQHKIYPLFHIFECGKLFYTLTVFEACKGQKLYIVYNFVFFDRKICVIFAYFRVTIVTPSSPSP